MALVDEMQILKKRMAAGIVVEKNCMCVRGGEREGESDCESLLRAVRSGRSIFCLLVGVSAVGVDLI